MSRRLVYPYRIREIEEWKCPVKKGEISVYRNPNPTPHMFSSKKIEIPEKNYSREDWEQYSIKEEIFRDKDFRESRKSDYWDIIRARSGANDYYKSVRRNGRRLSRRKAEKFASFLNFSAIELMMPPRVAVINGLPENFKKTNKKAAKRRSLRRLQALVLKDCDSHYRFV